MSKILYVGADANKENTYRKAVKTEFYLPSFYNSTSCTSSLFSLFFTKTADHDVNNQIMGCLLVDQNKLSSHPTILLANQAFLTTQQLIPYESCLRNQSPLCCPNLVSLINYPTTFKSSSPLPSRKDPIEKDNIVISHRINLWP